VVLLFRKEFIDRARGCKGYEKLQPTRLGLFQFAMAVTFLLKVEEYIRK
jgi:hypothetical protein